MATLMGYSAHVGVKVHSEVLPDADPTAGNIFEDTGTQAATK